MWKRVSKVLTDDNKEKYYKCKLTPPFGSCKIDKTSEGLCKKPADPVTPEGQERSGSEIQTEQFGPYTFYKGVLGFEGQGGLECNQTLNANPQEAANWCNTNLSAMVIIHILRMEQVVNPTQKSLL